jgi:hypothetical protein
LAQLSKSNPAEFKKNTACVSQQLAGAAKNSADPGQAQALSNLAANFRQSFAERKRQHPPARPIGSATASG